MHWPSRLHPGRKPRVLPVAQMVEPRILYPADLAAGLALGSSYVGYAETRILSSEGEYATASAELAYGLADGGAAVVKTATELAFVDVSVSDAGGLIQDLQAQQAAGRPVEIVRIEAGEDGIARLTETLAGRTGIAAVHVLGHGADGVAQVGSARLDAATLADRAAEIAHWGAALAGGADFLLYGCDVVAGPLGLQMTGTLAALTGADVAASTDLTGAGNRGGNWVLEYQTGRVEATVAISLAEQAVYAGVFANTAPTISVISDQTTPEDTSTTAISFTIGDAETPAASLVVTATSSNASILAAGGILLGGSGANRTVTLTPVANANGGPVTVTVSVSDGTLLTSTSFGLTVTPVNDAPVRAAGIVSDLTVLEDAPATSLGLGTLAYGPGGGADEASQTPSYTVTAVPAAALGKVVLADGTVAVAGGGYTLAQIQGAKFTGTPNANGGPATFAWQVKDNGGVLNGGVDTLSESLAIAVTTVNDAPAGANKTLTTLEDTPHTLAISDFG
ncbi:MAG: DUF4347 domain-containing protein, partial [Microbacteriaceae bacterium]|nr:DUF4347 domain-containing protein [Burkholderiaceae bacterium]